MNKLKLVSFILLLTSSISYSQSLNDSLYILPQNPTTTDSIYLVKYLFFPSVTEFIAYDIDNKPDNIIVFEDCHSRTDAGAITLFLDTFNLGIKEPGTYHINYKGLISDTPNECIPADSSSMSITFDVSAVSSLISKEPNFVNCYPNPLTYDFLSITSSSEMKSVEILTIEGHQLFKVSELNVNKYDLSTAEIAAGTFLLKIIDSQNNVTIKRIVKLE